VTPRALDSRLAGLERLGIRLDLGPMRELLDRLGRPERAVPVVLVAGTNGKGSTAAMLESIARAAGLSTGLATSPHLERVEERIRLGGRPVETARLEALVERVLAAAAGSPHGAPTYFEALVAAGFLAFADAGVDLAVVEVGLGGRLDATNCSEPALAVITPIALDHTELLGATLAAVAREKAGILRRGRSAVVADQAVEADRALARAAVAIGARMTRTEALVEVRVARDRGLEGTDLTLAIGGIEVATRLALAGAHQVGNAATAVAAARMLDRERVSRLPPAAIAAGLAAARWPGRLEPIPVGGATVLLDAAHNPHGVEALARFLDRLGRPFVLLFGALADKQVGAMLPPLAARARAVVLTRPSSDRALDPGQLAGCLAAGTRPTVEADPGAALDAALAAARGLGTDLVVACGSLYLIGPLRSLLRARPGVDLPD
jgi:dihydrofolate synthase/folylpolyglutamate synthase